MTVRGLGQSLTEYCKNEKKLFKEAKRVQETIIELLEDWAPYIFTITSDNGKEFAEHKKISRKLLTEFFFAHPYSP